MPFHPRPAAAFAILVSAVLALAACGETAIPDEPTTAEMRAAFEADYEAFQQEGINELRRALAAAPAEVRDGYLADLRAQLLAAGFEVPEETSALDFFIENRLGHVRFTSFDKTACTHVEEETFRCDYVVTAVPMTGSEDEARFEETALFIREGEGWRLEDVPGASGEGEGEGEGEGDGHGH